MVGLPVGTGYVPIDRIGDRASRTDTIVEHGRRIVACPNSDFGCATPEGDGGIEIDSVLSVDVAIPINVEPPGSQCGRCADVTRTDQREPGCPLPGGRSACGALGCREAWLIKRCAGIDIESSSRR